MTAERAQLEASLDRRGEYRWRVEQRPDLRALEREACASDPVHWFNHFVLTYDPRLTPAVRPFDLWPRQAELIRWLLARLEGGENGLIVKARDMGVTFLCTGFALHQWLFRPGCSIGFGSRKLELVDRLGDMDSIFEKIRFMLYALPPWLLPAGFDRERHDNQARILNPANESSLTGEGGANIGRGGRKSAYFVDEAAHLEHPESTDRALSATTNCRIDVSTPNGPGNPFARKRFGGVTPVFTFHWRDDPRKDDAWYARQVRELDPVTVAQEIDADFSASVENICIPGAWVRAAVNLDLPHLPGPVAAGLDVAEAGAARNVFIPRRGPRVLGVARWGQCNTTQTAHRAAAECGRWGATRLFYDAVGVGAGVRGTLDSLERRPPFLPVAVNGGATPTETTWPDGKTSRERFVNFRAELWWLIRTRFEKTYESVTQGVVHDPAEMISIPDDPALIADLSLPLYHTTEGGKIQIEGKDAMRRRGVKSPDHGDALAYSFAPDRPHYGDPAVGGKRDEYVAGETRPRVW